MSRRRRGGHAEPTSVARVEEVLAPGDFVSRREIIETLRCSHNQASAALLHLRRSGAADCIIEPDGQDYWLATPGTDQRSKRVPVRVPEEPGSRRPRRPRVKVEGGSNGNQ